MKLEMGQMEQLVQKAKEQLEKSYAPYSEFYVGAALLTKSGKIYTGCNIENAAASPGICAERTTIYKAVSEGEREFLAIAIVGGPGGVIKDLCPPCGVCRQVMMEFCDYEQFQIVLAGADLKPKAFSLKELLPMGFGPAALSEPL